MSRRDIQGWLRYVPADDVNYRAALKDASVTQLLNALGWLAARTDGNKSRMAAVKRELGRRGRVRR